MESGGQGQVPVYHSLALRPGQGAWAFCASLASLGSKNDAACLEGWQEDRRELMQEAQGLADRKCSLSATDYYK